MEYPFSELILFVSFNMLEISKLNLSFVTWGVDSLLIYKNKLTYKGILREPKTKSSLVGSWNKLAYKMSLKDTVFSFVSWELGINNNKKIKYRASFDFQWKSISFTMFQVWSGLDAINTFQNL